MALFNNNGYILYLTQQKKHLRSQGNTHSGSDGKLRCKVQNKKYEEIN